MKEVVLIILAALILAGCATRIDWDARIGVYTCDQAAKDYGPPMSQTTLKDGSTVAEWMTDRGEVVMAPAPYVYGPGYYSPRSYYGPGRVTYFPAKFLRLEFGADGRLKVWKEFSK
jgi:hypothetical protein